MAYEIHIARQASPITLDEWRQAVEHTEGVRIVGGAHTVTNQTTGEVITFGNDGGDTEIFFPTDGAWRRILRWSYHGKISFVAPTDFLQPTCRLRRIASTLARYLDASLTGDEGESYD